MNGVLMPLAIGAAVLLGVLAGAYAALLWHKLNRLDGKLDSLRFNCEQHRQDSEARFLHRLEHEVEHQGLWEALHHHEHDFRGRVRRE
jgi:hypothetical protein